MYFTWFLHPEWGGYVNAKDSSANQLFGQIVPKKCTKLKGISPREGGTVTSLISPQSAHA